MPKRVPPHAIEPSATNANVLATAGGKAKWLGNLALLLPAGSTSASVPAGTPVGTLIFIKA